MIVTMSTTPAFAGQEPCATYRVPIYAKVTPESDLVEIGVIQVPIYATARATTCGRH